MWKQIYSTCLLELIDTHDEVRNGEYKHNCVYVKTGMTRPETPLPGTEPQVSAVMAGNFYFCTT